MKLSFVKYYARSEADRFEPYFSPILAENLSHLPPALIITAEYDPLQDQKQKYAQRLHDSGNQVRLIDYSVGLTQASQYKVNWHIYFTLR
ncbi:MAG: alpha/beta hydrolase [Brasilonema angustatum HA4187-MV1]|jgi:acetyl esterase|nr:alpha/beta hydrolase [Brasilonema angustatum HA4187-MV1]